MTRSAKTVSIRHLHAAVKTALEAAKRAHPDLRLEAVAPAPSASISLPIYLRFPWIAGIPPFPWPEGDLQNITAFTKTFVANLASDKQISSVAADGKFEPTIYASGGTISIGFVPADVSFTE
jgi:hypothetical protein